MKLVKDIKPKDSGPKVVLLNEEESCSLAGVTPATLKSYTEFGLLKPIFKNEKPYYRELELSKLFNIEIVPTLDDLIEEDKKSKDNETQTEQTEHQETPKENLTSPVTETTEEKTEKNLDENSNTDFLPQIKEENVLVLNKELCLLYTSPSPRDKRQSRMPSSA